jgi:hypothetical protein
MMQKSLYLFALLVFLACQPALSQETKKISHTLPESNNALKETYHVLEDGSTREGLYELDQHGQMILGGLYKAGKRDGGWACFGFHNMVLSRMT